MSDAHALWSAGSMLQTPEVREVCWKSPTHDARGQASTTRRSRAAAREQTDAQNGACGHDEWSRGRTQGLRSAYAHPPACPYWRRRIERTLGSLLVLVAVLIVRTSSISGCRGWCSVPVPVLVLGAGAGATVLVVDTIVVVVLGLGLRYW